MLIFGHVAKAQFGNCVELSQVQPFYQCNQQFYDPVCGCDNITYRNQCEAFNVYGVQNWMSGVCSGIHLDFYPNPLGPNSELTINISHPEFVNANVDIRIVDMYGKVWVQRFVNNINRASLQFDLSVLQTGIYVIFISSSLNAFQVKKFSKY
ncbi:MAG: T9SS type A sorting domain-containing protein [Bacteroidota bacterium]|nr:T9SS type A sorting domain-containing protein [Bacteroidota bacterium]